VHTCSLDTKKELETAVKDQEDQADKKKKAVQA
jgi:hypothetical protein